MSGVRFGAGLVRLLVLSAALTGLASAQSIELTPPLARGNLFRGSATLTPDGRWVVFAGRCSSGGPGYNSLYCRASDASTELVLRDEIVLVAPSTPSYGSWQVFRAPLAGGRPARALNPPGTLSYPYGSRLSSFLAHPDQHRVLFVAHSEGIGLDSGARLFLGFLGQPIRGADRP